MKRVLWVAIGFMVLGMTLIPVGDAIAKFLSNTTAYSASFLAWARFSLGACILLPLVFLKRSASTLSYSFYARQSIRGVLIALTVVTIIKAVSLSPIAEVFGCFFIGPVLSVILSVILLGERAKMAEWLSVILGFVGVILVVQPAFFGFSSPQAATIDVVIDRSGLYWALLAGIFYGFFLVATRWAADIGDPLDQVTWQFMVAALVLAPFAIPDLLQYGVESLMFFFAMSLSSVLANYCSIQALARAKSAILAPVVYMQVVAATLLGIVIFNESLGIIAGLGLVIIVLSGFFRVPLPKHG